jgi:encore-like protein
LKREAHSFEDYRQGGLLSVHRSILNRKAKSFEEREEEYEKVKRRIFRNSREMYAHESMDEQEWAWFQQQQHSERQEHMSKLKVPSRLLKMHSAVSFI